MASIEALELIEEISLLRAELNSLINSAIEENCGLDEIKAHKIIHELNVSLELLGPLE